MFAEKSKEDLAKFSIFVNYFSRTNEGLIRLISAPLNDSTLYLNIEGMVMKSFLRFRASRPGDFKELR